MKEYQKLKMISYLNQKWLLRDPSKKSKAQKDAIEMTKRKWWKQKQLEDIQKNEKND